MKKLSSKEIKSTRNMKFKDIYGYQPEKDMPYSNTPYLIDGKKVCRRYISGVGFQQINRIYFLR
jgi:hypothetical protein